MVFEEDETVDVEQAAADRRERLRALKAARELLDTPDDDDHHNSSRPLDDDDQDQNDDLENNQSMKFRNYLPHDKQLQEGKLAPPVLPKFEDPTAVEPQALVKQEDPFLNIAPKKPNWDLRRDVQKKLDKLEKRTLKALHQLAEEEDKQREEEKQKRSLIGNKADDDDDDTEKVQLEKVI